MVGRKKKPKAYLAIDLGASSGRAIVGVLDGRPQQLTLNELHRFEHTPCPTPVGPVWDVTGIWLNIVQGIKAAARWCDENQCELVSIGVDTWGVDWTLVGESGELLGQAHCYRDPQNVPASERVVELLGGQYAIYERNGIQHMPINSMFQIAARIGHAPELFAVADRLLFMPDLFHFWLSGQLTTERTIASTSGLLSVSTGHWDQQLIEKLGLPAKIFGKLVEPGTVIGDVLPELAVETGISKQVQIIAPGAHDTASAVAAVPFKKPKKLPEKAKQKDQPVELATYLSSGTWSLLGAELTESFVSERSCEAPFTNERGLSETVRFLKNIGGLWLVQELRREYVEQGNEVSFEELADQARLADPFRTLVNPNAPQFASPRAMAENIRTFARQTDQPEPETMGDLVRCCLDSLALCYRDTIEQLESVLDAQVKTLHIVGGGVNNQLLNEITCGVLQRTVVCGPVEATAIGNLLTQAMGHGEVAGLDGIRDVVRHSFDVQTLVPADVDTRLHVTDEVLGRYHELLNHTAE